MVSCLDQPLSRERGKQYTNLFSHEIKPCSTAFSQPAESRSVRAPPCPPPWNLMQHHIRCCNPATLSPMQKEGVVQYCPQQPQAKYSTLSNYLLLAVVLMSAFVSAKMNRECC